MRLYGFLLLATCALLICSAGCLREGSMEITGIGVAPAAVTAGDVTLNVSVSIDRTSGSGAGRPTLLVRAIDTETGLRVNESSGETAMVGTGATIIASREIVLPRRGSYRLVAQVFEDGKRRANGELTVSSLEQLPPDDARTPVAMVDMDFIVRSVVQGRAAIGTEVSFTNEGSEPSLPLSIEIKARESDAGLLGDRQWTTLDSIRPGATVVRNVTLSVPDQYNYEVEAILWRGDVIVERGSRALLLAPNTTKERGGTEYTTRKIRTGEFVVPAGTGQAIGMPVPTMAPGFGGLLSVIGLLSLFALRRCRHG